MTSEEYMLLYEKYLAGTCTPEEEKLLMTYRDNFRMQQDDGVKLSPEEKKIRQKVYHQIAGAVSAKQTKVVKLKYWWSAAAVLLILMSAALFILKPKSQKLVANYSKPAGAAKSITPGSNIATLTLANGSVIKLGQAKNGVLSVAGNTSIKKLKDGELVYTADGSGPRDAAALNSISIPSGGQYQVTLPDGTKVWLNAVSTLTYPTSFTGNERLVDLKGEAYFEVAKNKKMPFKVRTNGVTVKVLGTHFNVKAYEEDGTIKTTLLEGSVQLSKGSSQVILRPGEQGAIVGNNPEFDVKPVNVNKEVAWKNGYFIFRNDNIRDIMKQISRWYNVDVEYRGNITNRTFGGSYSKYKDINELLKGLELTRLIHFKIEGRRIIVMP